MPTYEGLYKVSSKGRVWSNTINRLLSAKRQVQLVRNGHIFQIQLSALVACAFLGLDIEDPFRNRVIHADGDHDNCNLDNLIIEDTFNLENEEWRKINYHLGRKVCNWYEVSNLGRVRSVAHIETGIRLGKQYSRKLPTLLLAAKVDEYRKYKQLTLQCEDGSNVSADVHKLVANAFLDKPDNINKCEPDHINGDKLDNRACNLEWVTHKENMRRCWENNLHPIVGNKRSYIFEVDIEFNSMSDADKWLGRAAGYLNGRLKSNEPDKCISSNGTQYHFKVCKEKDES